MMTLPATSAPFSPAELAALRAEFPILSEPVHGGRSLAYLDNAASTQRPRAVIDALVDVYTHAYANVHRSGHALAVAAGERFEDAREAAAAFINARHAHEVIFTSGATAAINLVARSYGDAFLRPGDEILLTLLEHHSNIVPWQQLAERSGATIRFAPLTDTGEIDPSGFAALLTDRTKLVAFTAVSNVTGAISPVSELVALAHRAGAVAVVDAAQAAPLLPLDVQAWDADFVALSGHKLLGPSGVGVLYGREALLEKMPPFLGGGSMIDTVTTAGFTPARLPAKFEAGTPPIAPAIALRSALDFVRQVGLDRIHAHETALVTLAHELTQDISDLRVLGPPPEQKAGIFTFAVAGMAALDIAELLDQQGIAVRAGHHCAMPLHARLGLAASCRASFYLYNTPDEVARFAAALRQAVAMLR